MAALRESLKTTGYWGNIVARAVKGGAEIAYGHHRLVALKEEYGPGHKVDLLVRDLDDDSMLQIMARENMEEWGTSAAVEQETIRAVVEAFAEGRVHIGAISKTANKGQIRYAPSFVPGVEDAGRARAPHPYTAQTVADFIGWRQPSGEPQDKVHSALAALQFIEEGLLEDADFDGLTTKQAEAVISEARKARERREAAARAHQLQAEKAAREAAEAQKRREEAERQRAFREAQAAEAKRQREEADRQRRLREAEAAKARDEAARRRAQKQAEQSGRDRTKAEEARRRATEQAEQAKRDRQEADESRRQAEKRQQSAERHVQKQKKEGRESATTIGREVSQQLKAGKIGYRQAAGVAMKMEDKKPGPPPAFEDFVRRLMTDVNKILRPNDDTRTVRLEEIVKYKEYLRDSVRKDAATTLRQTGQRFIEYADDLWPNSNTAGAKTEHPALTHRK